MKVLCRAYIVSMTVPLLLAGCKPKDVPARSDANTPPAQPPAQTAAALPAAPSTEPNTTRSTFDRHTRQAMAALRTADIDRPVDRIQTALHVIGLPEAIVHRLEPHRLLVAFTLQSKLASREMVTKTATILSTVAGFEKTGEVIVVGVQHTHPMLAIRGDLALTVRALQGDLPWPDYLASLRLEPLPDQPDSHPLLELLAR